MSTGRRLLLLLHIVSSVGLVGAALVLVALGVAGVRGSDPRVVYGAAALVEAWLVVPLVVLALGTGMAQAVWSRRSLLRTGWITIKLATTAAFAVAAVLVLAPTLAANADAAARGEPFTSGQLLTLALVPSVAVVVLVTNAYLGLAKPAIRAGASLARAGRNPVAD